MTFWIIEPNVSLVVDTLVVSTMKYSEKNRHMGPRVKLKINTENNWCDNGPKQNIKSFDRIKNKNVGAP